MKEISDNILKAAQLDPSHRLIFATVNSREELDVHIRNSRGDDYSSSCAIAAAAAVVNGFLDRSATITHKLGEYYFQWLHPSNEIFITGSADYIYSGSISLIFKDPDRIQQVFDGVFFFLSQDFGSSAFVSFWVFRVSMIICFSALASDEPVHILIQF